jgi:hypothetical protein
MLKEERKTAKALYGKDSSKYQQERIQELDAKRADRMGEQGGKKQIWGLRHINNLGGNIRTKNALKKGLKAREKEVKAADAANNSAAKYRSPAKQSENKELISNKGRHYYHPEDVRRRNIYSPTYKGLQSMKEELKMKAAFEEVYTHPPKTNKELISNKGLSSMREVFTHLPKTNPPSQSKKGLQSMKEAFTHLPKTNKPSQSKKGLQSMKELLTRPPKTNKAENK